MTAIRGAYRRRKSEIRVTPTFLPSSVYAGRVRSDICQAEADHYPVTEVDPHSGGRQRDPRPDRLPEPGTLVAARPERRVGFLFGAFIGRVS